VEAPFQLGIAGRVVRGRIDAVYREGEGDAATYEIVDWKTNRAPTADPMQLAVYRLAWAEQQGVPLERVTAAFVYVRSGEVVRQPDLPGRAELERLLGAAENHAPAAGTSPEPYGGGTETITGEPETLTDGVRPPTGEPPGGDAGPGR
jgi:DNA helicase-2/ATP-dependent DNA helicase PcrA